MERLDCKKRQIDGRKSLENADIFKEIIAHLTGFHFPSMPIYVQIYLTGM
jgi:hypothetical protein